MEKIKDFNIKDVPVYKIAFAATSMPDYSMSRTILVEDYPNYGDFTLIEGGHCSCYGFDEIAWDAITYTEKELLLVIKGWVESGWGQEEDIAPLIEKYLEYD